MKRVWVVLTTVVLALSLTSCLGGASVKTGQKYLEKEKYDKAIEVFQKVIDKDETNYDAWFGVLDAQMEDDEFKDAANTLEDLFKVIDDNYKESDKESDKKDAIDYENVLEDFQDYAKDIAEEEDLGDWYYDLQPQPIDLYDYDYQYFAVGDKITLEVPKGMTVYYNLDDKKVSSDDIEYKDGIELKEEGSFTIRAAVANKFGMLSEESYAYVTVAVAPEAPVSDVESGTYPGPLTIHFGEYDENNFSIMYTTDGSDPQENGMYYYPEDGLVLGKGEYQLRAVMYDYNSYMYSKEFTGDYVVEAMAAPTVDKQTGTYKAPLVVKFSGFDPENQAIYYTLDGTDPQSYGYWYDATYGLELAYAGVYKVNAVIYDYYTYEYSDPVSVTLTIE